MNNITTLNNPKHLVTLGRKAPKRFTKDIFESIVSDFTIRLKQGMRISTSHFMFVRPTHNRNAFGDVDLVILTSMFPENWKTKFASSVTCESFFADIPGTDTTVFEYKGYQINVHAYNGSLSHAQAYLRNEGGGELISIIADSIDFKYDLNGLQLKTGLPDTPLMKVAVDASYIHHMLGIANESWEYYAYNPTDVFKFITSSSYFNRQVFLDLEADADRVSKSPILKNFIEHLKANPRIVSEQKFDATSENAKKTMMLNFRNYAPETLAQYTDLVRRSKIDDLFDQKFNPNKVSELTELTGEILIKFMNSFAETFKELKTFQMFVLTSLPETLNKALLEHKAATIKPEDLIPKVEVVAEVPLPPAVELPKLVGKAKAKAKAVAKKVKDSALAPVLEPVAKPKRKTPTKKVKTSASNGETFEVSVPDTAVVSTLPAAAPLWPMPTPRV